MSCLDVRSGIGTGVRGAGTLVLLFLKEGESAEGCKVVRNDAPECGNILSDLPILEGEGPFLASLCGWSLTYALPRNPPYWGCFCCIPGGHVIHGCGISQKGSHHQCSEPLEHCGRHIAVQRFVTYPPYRSAKRRYLTAANTLATHASHPAET